METLRKLSSMGRSKESKEAAKSAVKKASNGGGPNVEDINKEPVVGPSPPRARVTVDDNDEVEEVGDSVEDDSYDSAAEKMGTPTAASAADEVQAPKDAEAPEVSARVEEGEGSEKDEETEAGNGDGPRESFSNEESSSSPDVEEDDTLSREVSVRAMPVAKLTTENEEQEEDVEEDNEDEVDNEDEYEEANDEVLGEEEDASSAAVGGADEGTLPRIIARESVDNDYDLAVKEESDTSPVVEEEVEQAASTPLPDQEEKSVITDATETRETESPSPVAEQEAAAEEADDVPAVATPEVGEVLKEEDSSEVEEKSVEPVSSGPEEVTVVEEKQEEEEAVPQAVETEQSPAVEPELAQAVTAAAAPAFDVTGLKEEVAPEIVPRTIPEVGNVSKESEVKESEVEETEQAIIPPILDVESRGASPSLLEELRKLREQSSSEEVKPAAATESAPEEPTQSTAEKGEESADSDAVTVTDSEYVVKRAASNDLLAELKKLADARLEKEASDKAASASTKAKEASVSEPSVEKEEDTSGPEERVVDQKVVDVGDGDDSLDELKDLTAQFHMQGRPESDDSEVQSALATASDPAEQEDTDSSTTAVAERLSPEVAEVRIIEEGKVEDSGVVPSPANLFTALKAVDDELPASKAENGNAAETENVQSKPRGFSAADFTGEDGDSDADAEDEDEENDDDDDEDDEDDETDMDTAKALAELANAVGKSGSESGNKPSMGAAGPSLPSLPQRPAARKTAAASALDTAGRITTRPAPAPSTQLATTNDENANGETAEGKETREKLQNIRVKFLRLAHRLGQSPQNVVVAQVLYRLGLAESLRGGSAPNRTGAFSFDRANALAEEQEAANQDEELDFACTILVLGKTGVGKSATINSIFDDRKSVTSAFKPSTTKVQEIVGTVHGIKVRVIDTPGLLPSVADQQHNERIMGQVKKHIKKQSPDIVLYFDRLDMQSRDYGDLPLLRTITDLFGPAVWFNAIVVLTHASSAPPDGPNGVPLSYEMFVAQRSHVVQQTIRQAAGDMRLMNPVSLVENHPACRTNRNGQRVLPNGQIWKPQLLLLCFASKILAEANSLLKLQEPATPGRPFGQRSRVPPLPFLLSSLLQSRAQLKLPDEQLGESDESDDDEEEEDSDADDYDELPPFRPLSKEELEELSKEQRQEYMEELADRERLFQKKQYREEMRRRREMKKRAAQMSKEELAQPDDADDEAGKAAAVPVPMPDMALPPSFDSDNPTHRYRYLETANQWLVRPVLETHGWDHDAGYDGFNVEKMFVVKDKIPASISGQVTKDKKEAQVNFEAAASLKHGEGKVTLTGFDIQTIGKDMAYTLRAETRFNNFKRNKTTAGLTCTVLNDTVAAGLKLEDRILIGRRIKMVVNGGVLTGKGDKAFGGSLEATLRGKEYPLSRTLSTLGLSVMDWHGDLAIGGNLQSQFMVGKTMLVGRANLNNRGSGQVSIRASSSEQLQMVLIGVVPILRSLINCRFGFGQPSQ